MKIRPKIKICCISSPDEAAIAAAAGADLLGLVGPMPSGPGVLTPIRPPESRQAMTAPPNRSC